MYCYQLVSSSWRDDKPLQYWILMSVLDVRGNDVGKKVDLMEGKHKWMEECFVLDIY